MERVKGLRGVTFSQFDNHVGPRLIYSYPKDVISKEDFENLSDYAIVGKHLCGKLLTIKSDDIQFLNYSIAIENPNYERNTILFSFGFVLDSDVDPEPFSEVLKKVSLTFVTLELECEYLFQEATKTKVNDFLNILYHQLSTQGEIFIEIHESNILVAKLFKSCLTPREIEDYEVPLLLIHPITLASMNWDITIRHIIQYINGNNTAMEIANSYPGMDLDIVKRALRTLLYYKCIIVADKVKFTNIYELSNLGKAVVQRRSQTTTQQHFNQNDVHNNIDSDVKLSERHQQQHQDIYQDSGDNTDDDDDNSSENDNNDITIYHPLLIELLKFSIISNNNNDDNNNTADASTATAAPNSNNISIQSLVNNIIYILSQFKPKLNLASIVLCQTRCANLNIRRLLSFAPHHGFLRRIHEYHGHTTGTVIKTNPHHHQQHHINSSVGKS